MGILMFVSALRSSINRCYWSAKCYSCMFILSHEIINFNPKSLDYLYKVHNVRVPQGHLRVGGANIFQKGAADTVYPLASVSVYFCYLVFFFFFHDHSYFVLGLCCLRCSILYQLMKFPYQSHGETNIILFLVYLYYILHTVL